MQRVVTHSPRPHPPFARALQCFRCRKVLRNGLAPPSDGLCASCLTKLTVPPKVGLEVMKALAVLALFPALLFVAALVNP